MITVLKTLFRVWFGVVDCFVFFAGFNFAHVLWCHVHGFNPLIFRVDFGSCQVDTLSDSN